MDQIPYVVTLINRGVTLSSNMCCQCDTEEETSEHVLVRSHFAKTVLGWIMI